MTPRTSTPARRARGPRGELRRFEPVSDAVVLAAAERAECHHRGPVDGVTLGEIIEHLGFVRVGGWSTRSLRPQIDAFLAAGVLVPFRRFGFDFLKLSTNGRRRLARARRGGEIVLPESPQHRAWRHAGKQATEQVGAMRQLFRETLDEADRLLSGEQTGSDAWYALAPRIFTTCNQLVSVTYCLREWPEPYDTHADHDTLPHARRLPHRPARRRFLEGRGRAGRVVPQAGSAGTTRRAHANDTQIARNRRTQGLELCHERVKWGLRWEPGWSPRVGWLFGSAPGFACLCAGVFRPAERRLWMNVYVVMMACASLLQGCSGSPLRWSARRQGCSQRYWPTP
jgi:hypothetical protein